MRGGVIFYDDTVGFEGGTTKPSERNGSNIPANALASYWGLSSGSSTAYHEYAYDALRGCVVRTGLGSCRRFMVVDENDMLGEARGSLKLWDTSPASSTSRSTSTDFGAGESNTKTLCSAITDATTLWYTVTACRNMNIQDDSLKDELGKDISSKWFVPSRDELCVLLFMFYYKDSYRPTTGIYSKQLQLPFYAYYWSSSQSAADVSKAWYGIASDGYVYTYSKYGSGDRVRLCRTF